MDMGLFAAGAAAGCLRIAHFVHISARFVDFNCEIIPRVSKSAFLISNIPVLLHFGEDLLC